MASQVKLGDVDDLVRALLNKGANQIVSTATPAVLLPFQQASYRQVQRDFARNSLKQMYQTVIIALPVGGTYLGLDAVTPNAPLPADYLNPFWLKERRTGTSERFTTITRADDGLPQWTQNTHLICYEEQGDQLQFLGSTRAIDIQLRYRLALPTITDPDSAIVLRDVIDAMAHWTCYLYSRSKGSVAAKFCEEMRSGYYEQIETAVALHTKPEQNVPVRRIGAFSRLRRGMRRL